MPITPSYQRIVADIRQKIRSGILRPGDQLPTVAALQVEYGVGTTAVRNAMLLLREQGLVEGHQGKGVYVTADALRRLGPAE